MLRSVLSNWFGLVVLGLTSFVMTPILIHGLGDLHYGMWVLVASLSDYAGLLEIGIRQTLQRFVGKFSGADDRDALNQVFVTALALTLGFTLLLIGLTVGFSFLVPNFFFKASAERVLFQHVILLLGWSVALILPVRLLGTYLCGLQRFDLHNLGSIVHGVGRGVALIVAVRMGHGILMVSGITLLTAVLALPLHIFLVRWADPKIQVDWRQTSWKRVWELLTFSFYVFLNTVGDRLRGYTDSLVIGKILGVAFITPFSVAGRLIEYFKSIILALNGPLLPALSALEGQKRQRDLKELYIRGTKITAMVSVFIGSLLLLNGKLLLLLWVGNRFVSGQWISSFTLLSVLTVGYIVSQAQAASPLLLIARAKHKPLGLYNLSEGLANLGLSIYWAHKLSASYGPMGGLLGVALGTTVPMIIFRTLLEPWFALRASSLSAWEYVTRALVRPFLLCTLFLSISYMGLRDWPATHFVGLLFSVAWQTVLFASLTYVVGFSSGERVEIRKRLGIFGRRLGVLSPMPMPVRLGSRYTTTESRRMADGRLRILMISELLPYLPSFDGFRLYSANIIKCLSRRHDVELVSLLEGDDEKHLDWSKQYCSAVHALSPDRSGLLGTVHNFTSGYLWGRPRHHRKEIGELLQKRVAERQWDVVHAEGAFAGALVPPDFSVPGVLSVHDSWTLRCDEMLKCDLSLRERFYYSVMRFREPRWERQIYPRFHTCTVVAEKDCHEVRRVVPNANVVVVSNGTDTEYFSPLAVPAQQPTLVFHGHLGYGPNVEAAVDFATNIFPAIRSEVPDCIFHMAGAAPAPRLRALAETPGIRLSANVPDLRPLLAEASVWVGPMQLGTGIKNKVLEAMAMQRPVICYPSATSAIECTPGTDCLVARDPQQFVDFVLQLLRNPARADELARAGRKLVVEKYSWESRAQIYEELYWLAMEAAGNSQPRSGPALARSVQGAI